MRKLIYMLAIALVATSCVIYTKGEPGKAGKPVTNKKPAAMKNNFTVLTQAEHGGWENSGNIIIKSKSGLIKLYNEISVTDVPEVDFTNYNVIGLFMGQKSTGGYSISIKSVTVKGDVTEVQVEETKPEGMAMTVITNPYCIAVIPKTESVKFLEPVMN